MLEKEESFSHFIHVFKTNFKMSTYKSIKTIIFFATLFILGCSSNVSEEQAYDKAAKLFQKELNKNNVHNAFLKVYSPTKQIGWSFAGGNYKNGEQISDVNSFYTASIGKTFTATAISLLAEQGLLDFEDKINRFLPDSISKGLHIFNGIEYSDEITIAHLLQHTSGLPDYFEGETIDGRPNFMELIFQNPEKIWGPMETVQFAKNKMKPLFVPGTDYHYTDTEYILLGLIIENLSEMSLHDFFRINFFKPLEMKNTHMFLRSEPIGEKTKMAEVYAGEMEASGMKSLSADWAGGGLVSTVHDLIKFQEALMEGKIVSPETLSKMQNWVSETRGMEYGFGIRKISFNALFPLLPDLSIIGHSGSTGSFMYYCPELDIYLAGTLNQTDEVKSSVKLMVKVLMLIKNMED